MNVGIADFDNAIAGTVVKNNDTIALNATAILILRYLFELFIAPPFCALSALTLFIIKNLPNVNSFF
jgi:hypothetical protein